MLHELAELRGQAFALAERLSRARFRLRAGLDARETLPALLRAHPLALSPDGLAQAREALAEAESKEPRPAARVARLAGLRDFLVRARALGLEPGAAAELFELPRRALVEVRGDAGLHGAMPVAVAERELPLVRSRARRAELEAALGEALEPLDGARSAVFEAGQAALAGMGFADSAAAATALHARGWSRESPREAAEKLLSATDALVADLGGWLLERHTGAKPFPRGAERHDVLHLVHSPRCTDAFPAGELLRTVRRFASGLGLDLAAGGCISVDDDDRPLQLAGSFAEPLDPPHEVAICVRLERGPRALAGLLGAIGVAQLRAGAPGDAPPEDGWFGDPALTWAARALFEELARDGEFLRRCARVELGRDDLRTLGIAAVFDARLAAARTLASLAAHELGPGLQAAQAHRELFARAVLAELPRGLALAGIDPWLDGFAELRGRALAARLHAALRDRFDEDYWRNPRALPALQAFWGRGLRPTAAELWAELGGEPSIDEWLGALRAACG